MKALSVFSTLLLAAVAAAMISIAQAPGPSGRGTVNAARRPASTLTRPATPTKVPDEEGFIRRWLILEPIGANGLTDSAVQAAVKKEYFPNQFTVIPHDGDKVNVDRLGSHMACRRHEAIQCQPVSLRLCAGQANVQRAVLGRHRCGLPQRTEGRAPGDRL